MLLRRDYISPSNIHVQSDAQKHLVLENVDKSGNCVR